MSHNYHIDNIKKLTQTLVAKGWRVFVAESGTYGLYTDSEGSKVVSFQSDVGGLSFSGNYKTNKPKQTGTGWRLEVSSGDFKRLFGSSPPLWATGDATWTYTTLEQHLDNYQKSSKYAEVTA